MINIVNKICEILNLIKNFKAGYSTKNAGKGYMVFSYNDKQYAVKIKEIPNDIPLEENIESAEYYL